ncbi:MAG: glutathione S-transferase [Aquincola sp.]|nr:glutathione S-transferase [Aquincola sp.]MDH5329689.1 glutathione S-transferase [Aquincola sp.]
MNTAPQLTLCGFAISNYYNKVKFVLLEKGLPFAEEHVGLGRKDESVYAASPLGKVPFLRTERGALCESAVIVEYIEQRYPMPSLLPSDPWDAAKARELAQFIELHLELVARELYVEAFFGGTLSDSHKARVRKLLDRNIPAFKRMARFAPHAAGEAFTLADCAAYVHLPVVALATKAIYGEDLLSAQGIDWKAYGKFVGQRAAAQRIEADRKAEQARALAAAQARVAPN